MQEARAAASRAGAQEDAARPRAKRYRSLEHFCYPAPRDAEPRTAMRSEMFTFVLTDEDGGPSSQNPFFVRLGLCGAHA